MQSPDPTLVVVHYHYRAGGVRRVIERALPSLTAKRIGKVILVGGQPAPTDWLENVRNICPTVSVEELVIPGIRYASEIKGSPSAKEIFKQFVRLFQKEPVLAVWAHNLGLARNVGLAEGLAGACVFSSLPLVSHHHDLWCDNRWSRWREVQERGCRSLRQLAEALFPSYPLVLHATINRADYRIFRSEFGNRATWLPNPFDPSPPLSQHRIREARKWLKHATSAPASGKFWVLPCRLVRRKNIAEALFLARLIDPNAQVLTTGAPSTKDEWPYMKKLEAATRRQKWPLHLCAMDNGPDTPPIDSVIAAADVLMLTSVQEGFGLAYLEAQAAGRPLICRELSNVMPDLRYFGFSFPHSYKDLKLPSDWIDWKAERERQKEIFGRWKSSLPKEVRPLAGLPRLLAEPREPSRVVFSRLTLSGQLEAIASAQPQDGAESPEWDSGTWPVKAKKLSGDNYADRFWTAVDGLRKTRFRRTSSQEAQAAIIRDRLGTHNLYPILMAEET